jgi:hypothetical protein
MCEYVLIGREGPTLTNRGWGARKIKDEAPGLKPFFLLRFSRA